MKGNTANEPNFRAEVHSAQAHARSNKKPPPPPAHVRVTDVRWAHAALSEGPCTALEPHFTLPRHTPSHTFGGHMGGGGPAMGQRRVMTVHFRRDIANTQNRGGGWGVGPAPGGYLYYRHVGVRPRARHPPSPRLRTAPGDGGSVQWHGGAGQGRGPRAEDYGRGAPNERSEGPCPVPRGDMSGFGGVVPLGPPQGASAQPCTPHGPQSDLDCLRASSAGGGHWDGGAP